METSWIAFLAALGGAAIGGFASAWGAHLSTRSHRLRELHLELHRKLLPALFTESGTFAYNMSAGWPMQHWGDVVRAAESGDRRDREFARALTRHLSAYSQIREGLEPVVDDATLVASFSGPGAGELDDIRDDVWTVLAEYQGRLRRKLR